MVSLNLFNIIFLSIISMNFLKNDFYHQRKYFKFPVFYAMKMMAGHWSLFLDYHFHKKLPQADIISGGCMQNILVTGGRCELTNLDTVGIICDVLDEIRPSQNNRPYRDLIKFVKDRAALWGRVASFKNHKSQISNKSQWPKFKISNKTFMEFPPKSGHKVKQQIWYFHTDRGINLLKLNECDYDYKTFQYI